MLLDCRDLSKQFVPIDPRELRVVIINSMVKHELSGGEYAERRRSCEQGVALLRKQSPAIKALRDVTLAQLEAAREKMPDVVFRRCRHVITENSRTTEAAYRRSQLAFYAKHHPAWTPLLRAYLRIRGRLPDNHEDQFPTKV